MHILVPTRKTVKNNTHSYLNMSNSTSIIIIDKLIMYYQKTKPIKARIQGAINFLDKKRIKGLNKDIFGLNNVSHAMSYRILKSNNLRIHKNNSSTKKTKG